MEKNKCCHNTSDKSTCKISRRPRLRRNHLIQDFLKLQKQLGRRPTNLEYKHHCHTLKVLDRVFGKPGWRRLIMAVGEKALPRGPLTTDHLIQDYLETCIVLSVSEASYAQFALRHRHTMKALDRVFGKPGYKKLKKAAVGVTFRFKEQNKVRSENKIMQEIREIYRELLPGRMIDDNPTRENTQKTAWTLRNRLNDLFHELGRVVSIEDAFQTCENFVSNESEERLKLFVSCARPTSL